MITFKSIQEVTSDQALVWLRDLSVNLRPADRAEIEAVHGDKLEPCLIASAAISSLCWFGLADGTPFCVFGCAPSAAPMTGVAWLVGTPHLDAIPHTFVRNTIRHLREMHALYPCLFNYIDARNGKSMRWLQTCGFDILEIIPEHGLERRPFLLFARLDQHHV